MVLKFLGFGRSKKHSSSSQRPYPTVIEELCTGFSLADLSKATNNFDKKNVIGRGGFGYVYKGCLQLDHVATLVAVKRITHSVEPFKKEIELLCQLRHPNLISLIGFCIHEYERIIVYEYMSNGSLADHVFKRDDDNRKPLLWKKRLEICLGAARGVHYLHSGLKRTIIHRDIKSANILLDGNLVPKLSDFGIFILGALFTEKPKPIEGKAIAGTIGYIAPENIRDGILTDKFDVYSFGVVLSEVVCGKSIRTIMNEMFEYQQQEEIEMSDNGSESSDHQQLSEEIENSNNDIDNDILSSYTMTKLRAEDIDPALAGDIDPECYEAFIDIIERCLKEEPNERPTMGEVEVLLEHALILQEEADATYTSDDYFSLFTSITQTQQQQQEATMSA